MGSDLVRLVTAKNLEAYFQIASDISRQSPCIRRKYGAVIAYAGPDIRYVSATNARMNDRCCSGNICIRDRVRVQNGERTEVGAEIHAEIATLIQAGPREEDSYFILVGYDKNDQELYGKSAYPCHACALAIKYAGYRQVYMHSARNVIAPYSIARIIEEREQEWQPET